MRRQDIPVLLLLTLSSPGLEAQWFIAADAVTMWFGGVSVDTSATGENLSFRPYRPTGVGLRVERRFARAGVGLQLHYAEPALGLVGDDAVVAANDFLALYEAALEASWRIARTASGVDLRAHAGPVLDLWSVSGDDGLRVRWGALAAASVEFALGRRFAGAVRASGALTPSVFEPGELPPEFVRRAMRRGSVSLGIRYQL